MGPGEGFVPRLDPIPDVADLIERAVSIDADRRIKPGFHTELDSIAESVSLAQATLLGLERRLRERTNIRSLKVGYNKVFGYYIEVTKSNLRSVPADFVRRQTLANAERFVTEELQTCEAAILRAEERIAALEERVFAGVRDTAGAAIGRLLATAAALAELDVLASFAQVAAERRYVRPLLDNSGDLHIEGGRHPVVEASLEDGAFIANDCRLAAGNRESAIGNGESPVNKGPLPTSEAPEHSDTPISAPPTADCRLPIADSRILLITGPNMAGKSTYLRQVALIVLMAQVGSFVPAASARIGLVDRIFTRVGAHDDLAAGASTFLVEMVETAAILRAATSRSLLVFDEIGRGTSTFDGLSIAQAVVEDVHDRIGARTLFATHYHELTTLADRLPALSNANAAAVEEGGRVVFLHRIRPGGADRSYGIHVGEIAGLPAHVTARARIILAELEGKRTAALTPDPSPEFVRGEPDRHGPASISPTPAAPIDELGTSFELGSPLPLAGEGSGVRAALLTIDLARTTPLDALNLLARLQEQAQIEEAPGPPLRLVREHRDHQSAP
ncbi:MAG: DNA mismatch repair protein MutS [Dehalococcoidia bacterium]